ncbi:oligosaccharide flippase family protein [Bradyrhizobium japonicum]|nr:oligosaccharide flippase family protein [Bradyrhizobium japonicum]
MLTPEQFGVAALVLSVSQIVQPMIDALFHDVIVQKDGLDDKDLTSATTFCLIWSALLSAAIWLLSPWLAASLSAPAMETYLPWLGVSLVFSGLSAVASAEARRNMQFRWLAIRTIVGRAVGMIVGLWLAWHGEGIWAIVLQAMISTVASSSLLIARTGVHIGAISWTRLKPLLAFAAPTMGTQVLLYANSRIVTLLIGGALGPIAAGTWSVAFRFVEPLQAVLATTIGQFCLPIFSRKQADAAAIGRYFSTGTRYFAVILVPLFLGLAMCANYIVLVFVGEKWLDAVPIMRIVSIVTMLLLLRQLAELVLTARGRPQYTFYTHLCGSVLSIFGVYCGGLTGLLLSAAIGWSARVLPFITLNAFFVRNELGLSLREQFSQAALPVGAGVVMCGALYALEPAVSVNSQFGMLAVMICAGAAIYGIVLLSLDGEIRRMLADRVRQLRGRSVG